MSRDYLITLFKVYFMLLANKYATILIVLRLLKLSSKFTLFRSPQFMYIFLSIIQLQEKPDISHKLASTIIQKINYNNFWTSFCEKHQRATALSLSISSANVHALSLLIFPTEISSICTFVLDLCYRRQY